MSLQDSKFCVTCHKSNVPDLKLCTKCRVVRYCSRKCQRKDFNSHKDICGSIDGANLILQRLEENYKTFKHDASSKPINLWETHVGRFSSIQDTRNWFEDSTLTCFDNFPREYLCGPRSTHRYLIWQLADKHESYEMTEIYLNYLLETLRLDAADVTNIKTRIPIVFILLGNIFNRVI